METKWFKKAGWMYFPVNVMGFVITIIAIALDVWFFIANDRNSHSVSDTLISFFMYFSVITFWWKWVANKTS